MNPTTLSKLPTMAQGNADFMKNNPQFAPATPPPQQPSTPAPVSAPNPVAPSLTAPVANAQTTPTAPATSASTPRGESSVNDTIQPYYDTNGNYITSLDQSKNGTLTSSDKYAKDTAANDAASAKGAENFQKYVTQMQNGTIPLNPYEQAQIDATTNSFNSVMEAQKLANKNYEAGVGVANEARGLSRYSPAMAQGEILSAVTEGNKKVADLNTKMQQSLATMKQGFQDNKYASVKDAYNVFVAAQKEKTATIENTYKIAAAKEKLANEAQQDAYYGELSSIISDNSYSSKQKNSAVNRALALGLLTTAQVKDLQTQLKDSNKGIEDIAKIVAENGGTPAQINKVLNSNNENEAYANASGLLGKEKTGAIGEYEYYVNQERQAGRHPLSFMDFKNYSTNTTTGGGINPITGQPMTKADQETEDAVKRQDKLDLQTVNSNYSTIQGILKKYNVTPETVTEADLDKMNDSDVIAIGKATARVINPDITRGGTGGDNALDPTSIVEKGKQAGRAIFGGKQYLPSKVLDVIKTAKAAKDERQARVDNPIATQLMNTETVATNTLNGYISNHPEKSPEISSKMDSFEKSIGRPATVIEFLQVYPEYK